MQRRIGKLIKRSQYFGTLLFSIFNAQTPSQKITLAPAHQSWFDPQYVLGKQSVVVTHLPLGMYYIDFPKALRIFLIYILL